ncbi:hypothetical protein [Marisediminicola senii]|uniref:hypothetical protein n=1 Tax=Marisediminicola senii TaxID=2711233 RepID=UPI0013EB99B5|nr:hypothetical protein [Marisediminicola senii]
MNDGQRTQLLRREMVRRVNDGWNVTELNPFDVTLVHPVDAPWWRLLLVAVNPVFWFTGFPLLPNVERWLAVTIDEDGTLWRSTVGDVPPSWQRDFSWEVPDGPVPHATTV